MARRIDLRAYQESIASRLAAAEQGAGAPALLGFEAAGRRWLIHLPAAGEVLPPPPITPVPLCQPWLAGLANVHGELVTVVDFAAFCGFAASAHDGAARLLRIGLGQQRHPASQGVDCALLVARVFGLKRADSLFAAALTEPGDTAENAVTEPGVLPWQGDVLVDHQGVRWWMLDIDRLLADADFADAAWSAQATSI